MRKPIRTKVLVTERDYAVLEALASYRFLSVPQLATLFFSTTGAAAARLRRLHDGGLVARVFMPVRPYDRRSESVYALGAGGATLLVPRFNGERPKHLTDQEKRSALFLDHTLRRNDVRICLERMSAIARDGHLVWWKQAPKEVAASAEVRIGLRQHDRIPIVPDGTCQVFWRGRLHSFAVEIDMGTVRLASMALRYRAYWQWWRDGAHRKQFDHAPLRVLTLTTTKRRQEALRRAAIRAPDHGQRGSKLFWFAQLSCADITDPTRLVGPAWSTAMPNDPGDDALLSP